MAEAFYVSALLGKVTQRTSRNMHCECFDLPDIFNIETYPNNLMSNVNLVDEHDGWFKLYKCKICNGYWQIDVVDKYQTNCAIKIEEPGAWKKFDDKPLRFQYLIDSRGGLSERECLIEGCKNNALKSLEYCPNHAFDTLGLRE